MSAPRLLVVTGSTRPSRQGPAVSAWVEQEARQHSGFEVETVDLAELALPLLDEPHHPRLGRYEHEHTRRWSALVDRSDAFVLVFPEYNHSFPAPVKNALDYLHREWADKAVGLVSYGGASSGLRAAAALKPVLTCLRMVPVVEAVSAPFFAQFVDDAGVFVPNEVLTSSATAMLDELARVTAALSSLRATSERAGAVAGSAGR